MSDISKLDPSKPQQDTFFIVRVRLQGGKLQPARWAWLGRDAGYPTHWSDSLGAHGAQRFAKVPNAAYIRQWSGSPHYDIHDLTVAPEIYKIVETRTVRKL